MEIEIDEYIETEVRVIKTIELTSDELLEQIDLSDLANILETAIGPLVDDLYRAVKDGNATESEYHFEKIYETIDRQKPVMFEDAA